MRPLALLAVLALSLGASPDLVTDLGAVADRLGGRERFDAITSLRLVTDVEAVGPAGEVALRSTLSMRLSGEVRLRQELPSSTVTTVWADGAVRVRVRDTTRVLRPEAVRRFRSHLLLSLPVLLARRADLVQEGLDWEGDNTILTLRARSAEAPVRLVVGPDGLPVSASTRLEGTDVAVAFSRYRRTAGLLLPFASVQSVDGDTTGTASVVSVEVNPALPDRLFSLD